MTLRNAAKSLGIKLSQYLDYQRGADVCPHEYFKKQIAGCHPPLIVLDSCCKCGHILAHRSLEEEMRLKSETS